MHITKIEIDNFKGIKHYVYDAGMFNDITGDNEAGKTSFQDAIAWALRPKNTHNPKVIRNGAEKAVVRITFDDHNVLTSTATEKESTQDFTGQKKAGVYIQGITDIFALNPSSFIVAKKEDRLKILLEALPLQMDWNRLETILGFKAAESNDPVASIEYWEGKIYEDRRQINTLAEDRERTVNELLRSLPPEDPEAPEQLIKDLESQKTQIEMTRDNRKEMLTGESRKRKEQLISDRDAAIAKANSLYSESIDELTREFNSQNSKIQADFEDSISPINQKLGETREMLRNYDSITTQRKAAELKRSEAKQMREESEQFTAQIKSLKELKKALLTHFPIPGITIRDGGIYLNDVEFDSCAESQQMAFCLTLAKFVAMEKELPLIRMDRLEALSPERFNAFRDAATKTGVQHWVSRVVPQLPLTVTAYN